MNLCSHNHDEVCFEGRICPVCEKQKELDAAEDALRSEKEETASLEKQLAAVEETDL